MGLVGGLALVGAALHFYGKKIKGAVSPDSKFDGGSGSAKGKAVYESKQAKRKCPGKHGLVTIEKAEA